MLVYGFINDIYNRTVQDNVILSVMSEDVTSLG